MRQGLNQAKHMIFVNTAKHLSNLFVLDLSARVSYGLIGQGQRISHGPPGRTGQAKEGALLRHHVLQTQHMLQVLENGLWGHRAQIELQTTREHRHGDLLRVGGGQDELQILGRLLQSF